MTTDLDKNIAAQVASATRVLRDAEKALAAAVEKVAAVDTRLAVVSARRQEITARRLAGEILATETAEFVALGFDQEALTRLRAAAQTEATALEPAVAAAQTTLERATGEWSKHVAETKYAALMARVRAHEAALLLVIEATLAAGREVGHLNTRQSWMPTDRLRRVVTTGAV